MTGNVTSVSLVDANSEYQLLAMTIGIDTYYIFGDYNYYLPYVGKDVMFSVRNEVINGKVEPVIVTLAERTVIQTLDKEKLDVRLIPKDTTRAVCNFSIDDLRMGDIEIACICYLSSYELGSSNKAKWVDLSLIDKNSKLFNVKLFNNSLEEGFESVLDDLIGRYVSLDIRLTRYGYQTDGIEVVEHAVVEPPEVTVAYEYILNQVSKDEYLTKYVEATNLLDSLRDIIYYEKGYHLVEIASEMMLIEAIDGLTDDYDMQLLKRMAIATRGYLHPKYRDKYSIPVSNCIVTSATELRKDTVLMDCIDSPSEKAKDIKQMYTMIRSMAKFIINKRKGNEDETDKVLKAFSDSFMFNVNGRLFF